MELNFLEVEPSTTSFYYSVLEDQVRTHLKDSEVRLTEGIEGRLNLDIREDLLAMYLDDREVLVDEVQQLKDEREVLVDEVRHLKDLLDKAQKRNCSTWRAAEKSQAQTAVVKDLQLKVKVMKRENEDLHKELETVKSVAARAQASRQAQRMKDTGVLENERLRFHREKTSLLEELNVFKNENNNLLAALEKTREKLLNGRQQWEKEKFSLMEDIKKCKASSVTDLNEMAADLKKAQELAKNLYFQWQEDKVSLQAELEKSQSCSPAQHDEINHLRTCLKSAEHQLDTVCQQWYWDRHFQQMLLKESHSSSLAQMEMQKKESHTFEAALKTLKEQLDNERLQWQQEKSSLLQKMEQSRAPEWETESIQDLQVRLKFLKGEKESLQNELEAKTLAARSAQASQKAQLEKHRMETKRIGAVLRKAEALQTEYGRLLEEKNSLVENMEKSRASYEVDIDNLKKDNNQLTAAVTDAERQMRTKHLQWLNERFSLLDKLEKSQNNFHNFQLKLKEEKEALQVVEKEHRRLLQEKQLELESTERYMKGELEEHRRLLQEKQQGWESKERYMKGELEEHRCLLQEKQQEWESKERYMKGELEEIKNQLSQKTKKKKWYRRLI